MDEAVFIQAVNELFSDIDEEIKKEIIEKVIVHMNEFTKRLIYQDDSLQLDTLNKEVINSPTIDESRINYEQAISSRLSSLTESTQLKISEQINQELTRVMHQIYLAYTNNMNN